MDIDLHHRMKATGLNGPLDAPSTSSTQDQKHFDVAFEKYINQQVERSIQEDEAIPHPLLPLAARRAKIEHEVRKGFDFPELETLIISAVQILYKEGSLFLSKDLHATLMQELEHIPHKLGQLEVSQLEEGPCKAAMAVSKESLAALLEMATAKYSAQQLPDSLALFGLLSLLDSESADYAYRFALTLKESKQYPLAVRTFATVSELAPQFAGSYIFAAQCYLEEGEAKLAVEQLAKAKTIAAHSDEWAPLIATLENLIGT